MAWEMEEKQILLKKLYCLLIRIQSYNQICKDTF